MIIRCQECKKIVIPDTLGRCPLCGAKCDLTKVITAPVKPKAGDKACHMCGKKADLAITKKETLQLAQDTTLEYMQFIFWPVMALLRIFGLNTNYRVFKVKVPICAECKKRGLVTNNSFQNSIYSAGEAE